MKLSVAQNIFRVNFVKIKSKCSYMLGLTCSSYVYLWLQMFLVRATSFQRSHRIILLWSLAIFGYGGTGVDRPRFSGSLMVDSSWGYMLDNRLSVSQWSAVMLNYSSHLFPFGDARFGWMFLRAMSLSLQRGSKRGLNGTLMPYKCCRQCFVFFWMAHFKGIVSWTAEST